MPDQYRELMPCGRCGAHKSTTPRLKAGACRWALRSLALVILGTTPTALSAPQETTLGRLTPLVRGLARTVARARAAGWGRTNVHRSPLGSVATRHAALTMSGRPLTVRGILREAPYLGERRLISVYLTRVATRFPKMAPIRDRPCHSSPRMKSGAPWLRNWWEQPPLSKYWVRDGPSHLMLDVLRCGECDQDVYREDVTPSLVGLD